VRSTVDSQTVLHPRADVRIRRVGGEVVVGLAGNAFSLSNTTAFIWLQVDGRRTIDQIARLVAAHYDVDPAQALVDTIEILQELRGLGLFTAGAPAS
jgi:hypothetical protein